MGVLPLYYLARGGIVFDFYVLAVIPFLCLNLASPSPRCCAVCRRAGRGAWSVVALAVLLLGQLLDGRLAEPLYTERPAGRPSGRPSPGSSEHLPAQSRIVMYDIAWIELHERRPRRPRLPRAHSHWKVALDPAIRSGVFQDDWRTVDYLLMTPSLPQAFQDTGNTVADQALQNASSSSAGKRTGSRSSCGR